MNAAQYAYAILTGVFLLVALAANGTVTGYITLAVAVLGYVLLLGMILNDARPQEDNRDT